MNLKDGIKKLTYYEKLTQVLVDIVSSRPESSASDVLLHIKKFLLKSETIYNDQLSNT